MAAATFESRSARAASVGLALAAAFGWATYYLFVLWVSPGTRPSAVLFYPFLAGAVVYLLASIVSGQGRALARTWSSLSGWGRAILMVGTQVSVLAATYLMGAVNSSLLSLIGDVVATPVIAALFFAGPKRALGTAPFALGLLLSLVGGSVAILGGQNLGGVHGAGWLLVVLTPLEIGFFFVLSARASETVPSLVIVGQAIGGAAIGVVALAPWIPGGFEGLTSIGLRALLLLLVNGVVSFFVAPWLYFAALRREGLVVPPMLMTGIPIFTLALTVGVLGESTSPLALVGIPIAVVGGLVILRAIAPAPMKDGTDARGT